MLPVKRVGRQNWTLTVTDSKLQEIQIRYKQQLTRIIYKHNKKCKMMHSQEIIKQQAI